MLFKEMSEVRKNCDTSMSTYLENVLSKILQHELVCDKGDRSTVEPIMIKFVQPEDLEGMFGNLKIGQEPTSDEILDEIVDNVIQYSVKTSSPRFHNQVTKSHHYHLFLSKKSHRLASNYLTLFSCAMAQMSMALLEAGFQKHSIPTTTPMRLPQSSLSLRNQS